MGSIDVAFEVLEVLRPDESFDVVWEYRLRYPLLRRSFALSSKAKMASDPDLSSVVIEMLTGDMEIPELETVDENRGRTNVRSEEQVFRRKV